MSMDIERPLVVVCGDPANEDRNRAVAAQYERAGFHVRIIAGQGDEQRRQAILTADAAAFVCLHGQMNDEVRGDYLFAHSRSIPANLHA